MALPPSNPPGPLGSGRPPGAGGPPFPPRPRLPRGRFEQPNKDEHRINERIRVPQVRLIDEKGEQVGIVPTFQALTMARERGLDLMEVSPNAAPPVCKICDYGKFKYEKKKKDNEARKKQTVIKVKEVQLRPQTEEHDFDYKFRNIRKFLEDGDKAKITIMFRGREITYVDQGHKMMRELMEKTKDIAMVEAYPKLEGKKLIMILAPGSSKGKPGMPVANPRVIVVPPPGSTPAPTGESNSDIPPSLVLPTPNKKPE